MSTYANRWIVGLDLRPAGQGALRFARWLASDGRKGDTSFVGIHVLVEDHLQAALRYHHLDELTQGAREQAQVTVSKANATDIFGELHVVQGHTAEQALEKARVEHGAGGVVVGRQAPRSGHHVFRLGKVARRMLRTLQAPVVVVPPDWEPAHVTAAGPVICATNLCEGVTTAAHFAAGAAAHLSRPLVMVHAVSVPENYGAHYLPEASRKKIASESEANAVRELAAWLEQQGITGAQAVVRPGHVIEQVLDLASETNAALLVTGSRRLSTMERLLLNSVSSDLAASAPCPVAVVPPPPAT